MCDQTISRCVCMCVCVMCLHVSVGTRACDQLSSRRMCEILSVCIFMCLCVCDYSYD